jgi:hypothetical protein
MKTSMLTTVDNPHSPFDNFDEWYAWDARAGYHTPGYLARIVVTSPDLSSADEELAIEQGIDEIIREDPTGMYIKVFKEV